MSQQSGWGVCGNKVFKGCRRAPSAERQMTWITGQTGRPEEDCLGASGNGNLCVTVDGPGASG